MAGENTTAGEETSIETAAATDYERIREIVRDELDTKLQNVLHVGDAPSHDEVAEMIASGAAKGQQQASDMIAAELTPLRAQVQANEVRIAEFLQKLNDQFAGVADMVKTVNSKVDTVVTEVQLYRQSADRQMERINSQADKTDQRVDSLAPLVGRLDDAVFGGTDGTPGIRATVGKVHATVGRIDQWVQAQIARQEARERMMSNLWKVLNYPAVKFALLGLMGSALGVSVFEIARAIG